MSKFALMMRVNDNPRAKFKSECGQYEINPDRYSIVWQQGMPVVAVNFEGIPEDVKWIEI